MYDVRAVIEEKGLDDLYTLQVKQT